MANAQQEMEIDMEALDHGSETTFDTSSIIKFPPLPSPSRLAVDNTKKGTLRRTRTKETKADPPQQTSSRTNEEHQTRASAMEATLIAETKSVTDSTRSSVTSGDTGSRIQGIVTTNTTKPANLRQNRTYFLPPSRGPRSTHTLQGQQMTRIPTNKTALLLLIKPLFLKEVLQDSTSTDMILE